MQGSKQKNDRYSPIIGISSALLPIDSGSFMGRERVCVVRDYIEAIRLSEGVPILLPVLNDHQMIERQMQLIDGLLLTGGADVAPFFYKEEPSFKLGPVSVGRDRHEFHLLEAAVRLQKPVFGICRGLQVINVAFGGTLYQDIESSLPTSLQHYQMAKPEDPWHAVALAPDSKLRGILESECVMANSFHHQAIKDLAPGLIACARAPDGLIEGVEGVEHPFILGVQWHPELMFEKEPKMLVLFKALVNAARKSNA